MKRIIIINLIFILFLIIFLFFNLEKKENPNKLELKEKIDSILKEGIDFLYNSQLEDGEFKSYYCFDKQLNNCYFDSSPFVTTFILYSIKDISNSKISEINKIALKFLLEEQKDGLWSYWTSKNNKTLVSDLDDTSCTSFILRYYNQSFYENIEIINQNKDENNLYYTWINPSFENDIDCVVNVNILLYLQNNDPIICDYLNNAIINNKNCSIYYPSKFSFYYMISRAYNNNIICFEDSKEKIIKEIINSQRKDGSVGDLLETSLALNTLINFNYKGYEIDKIVDYLILNFERVFSSKNLFYSYEKNSAYFYSNDLTLSVYLEGLNKYYKIYLN